MTEYVCVVVVGNAGESAAAFKARLTAFWTHMLRNRPDDYERVYAEATRFGTSGGKVARQYLVEAAAAGVVVGEMTANGIASEPFDPDDTYTKYEATSPDWFQIEH